jgi:hypothetical protein
MENDRGQGMQLTDPDKESKETLACRALENWPENVKGSENVLCVQDQGSGLSAHIDSYLKISVFAVMVLFASPQISLYLQIRLSYQIALPAFS